MQSYDLLPTVLDVLGVEQPPCVLGRSALPLLGGGDRASTSSRRSTTTPACAPRSRNLLTAYEGAPPAPAGEPRLFDLHADPQETTESPAATRPSCVTCSAASGRRWGAAARTAHPALSVTARPRPQAALHGDIDLTWLSYQDGRDKADLAAILRGYVQPSGPPTGPQSSGLRRRLLLYQVHYALGGLRWKTGFRDREGVARVLARLHHLVAALDPDQVGS